MLLGRAVVLVGAASVAARLDRAGPDVLLAGSGVLFAGGVVASLPPRAGVVAATGTRRALFGFALVRLLTMARLCRVVPLAGSASSSSRRRFRRGWSGRA
ncbi:hypothetical protein ACFQZ4_52410 [Catellatospora coxensis]